MVSLSNISSIQPQKNSFIIKQCNGTKMEFITINDEYSDLNSWVELLQQKIKEIKKQRDPYHSMLPIVKKQIMNRGFAKLDELILIQQCNYLVTGYTKSACSKFKIPNEIDKHIQNYLLLMNLLCWNKNYMVLKSGGAKYQIFVIAKQRLKLSKYITNKLYTNNNRICTNNMECNQIPADTLELVMIYLAEHKGIEPGPIACPVRSIHMVNNVSYKWDAAWVDTLDKKTCFEVILAANKLEIKSLLHLGCAKIATLIKQLDQSEINRIIDQEEEYRRKQAEAEKEKLEKELKDTLAAKEDKKEDVVQGLDDDENEVIEEKEMDKRKNATYYVEFKTRPYGVRICCMDEMNKSGGCITEIMGYGDENREKCQVPSQIVSINDGVNNENVKNKSNDGIINTLRDIKLPFTLGLMKVDKNPCTRDHHGGGNRSRGYQAGSNAVVTIMATDDGNFEYMS